MVWLVVVCVFGGQHRYSPRRVTQNKRTHTVWALGCLLFAMMFGYSPFECDFPDGAARPRVVECSYLRVIGRVPFPVRHKYSPQLVETVGCVRRRRRRPVQSGWLGPPAFSSSSDTEPTLTTQTQHNRWILQQDPKQRPFVTDVLRRVEDLIASAPLDPVSKVVSAAAPPAGSVALEMAPLAGAR